MKREELKEKYKKAETQQERDKLAEDFFKTNARVRYFIYAFLCILTLTILWIAVGIFIRLIKFIAF